VNIQTGRVTKEGCSFTTLIGVIETTDDGSPDINDIIEKTPLIIRVE